MPVSPQLLEILARHRGRLITSKQLLQDVWGPSYHTETHYLRVYMAQLRRKLEPNPARPRHLLIRFRSLFARADTEAIARRPMDFDAEARGLLRQLEVALRETYFHPSKVPTSVTGDEERAMPQQQQQQQQRGQAMA